MAMARYVLLTLLALVLILPAGFILSPAAVADDGEPETGGGVTYTYDGVPQITGTYRINGKLTYYDWIGNKVWQSAEGQLRVECQDGHRVGVEVWLVALEPAGPSLKMQTVPQTGLEPGAGPCVYNGWVGAMLLDDKGKVKNKPRLSVYSYQGTYPSTGFGTTILNAQVKLDPKTHQPKKIKGTINHWMLSTSLFPDDSSSRYGVLEGKFTATPGPD